MKRERTNKDEDYIKKEDLIDQLSESPLFSKTHEIIKKMSPIDSWESKQIERILKIALANNQVRYILKDHDVKNFYEDICKKPTSRFSQEIKDIIG